MNSRTRQEKQRDAATKRATGASAGVSGSSGGCRLAGTLEGPSAAIDQQAGLLTCWSMAHLEAGAVREADLVLLLLSASFFADADCSRLAEQTLAYQHAGGPRVVLLLRPVLWRESALRNVPCLPTNGVPVLTWIHEDAGWHACAQGVLLMLGLPGIARSE